MKGLHKNTNDYKLKAAELKVVENNMSSLRKQIGLTAMSQKELTAELRKLQAMKGIAIPQSKEFFELEKRIVPEPMKARPCTRPVCPPKIPPDLRIPVLGSQSLMVLSSDPLTSRVESGLKQRAVTTSA
jgi:hypothetical protein